MLYYSYLVMDISQFFVGWGKGGRCSEFVFKKSNYDFSLRIKIRRVHRDIILLFIVQVITCRLFPGEITRFFTPYRVLVSFFFINLCCHYCEKKQNIIRAVTITYCMQLYNLTKFAVHPGVHTLAVGQGLILYIYNRLMITIRK